MHPMSTLSQAERPLSHGGLLSGLGTLGLHCSVLTRQFGPRISGDLHHH